MEKLKLNPDCIRDILLTVEETVSFGEVMRYDSDTAYTRLSAYTPDEVMYHIEQCELSGLLTKVNWFMAPGCLIHNLSPAGHEFLANIRNDTNWAKTKDVAKEVGSFSLTTLTQIAVNVVTALINKQF